MRTAILGLLLIVLPAVPSPAQEVTYLFEAETEVPSTGSARLVPLGGTVSELISVGNTLSTGDLIYGERGDLVMGVTCPEGSELRFTGFFRVMIAFAVPGIDCAVDLMAGEADLLTDVGTEVNVGGKGLGTEGTRYAVSVRRRSRGIQLPGLAPDGSTVEAKVLVFDGKVKITEPRREAAVPPPEAIYVNASQALEFEPRETPRQPRAMADEELESWAGKYARYDVLKAKARGVEMAPEQIEELRVLHRRVLAQPADARNRSDLAARQVELKLVGDAVYHLEAAGVPKEELPERPSSNLRLDTSVEESRLRSIIRGRQGAAFAPSKAKIFRLLDDGNYLGARAELDSEETSKLDYARFYLAQARTMQGLGSASDAAKIPEIARKALGAAERGEGQLEDDEIELLKTMIEQR